MRTDILASTPEYTRLKKLFSSTAIFAIPRYQRGFAWKAEKVDDFIGDLEALFEARADDRAREHFFGTLVTTKDRWNGIDEYRVIDGQQRLICFNILVRAILTCCEALKRKAEEDQRKGIAEKLVVRIRDLTETYLNFEAEVKEGSRTSIKSFRRLTLSAVDRNFYYDLADGARPRPSSESNRMLSSSRIISRQAGGRSVQGGGTRRGRRAPAPP